jgi:pSer/pThr/pTyr-binding forkhead associated (FHA) protein
MSAAAGGAALRFGDGHEQPVRHALRIGRSDANQIQLAAPSVSRQHAQLLWNGERWCIEDLGSANGTFVNDQRIPFGVPHPLRHHDRIRLGSLDVVFSWPAEGDDPDRTDSLEVEDEAERLEAIDSALLRDVRLSPLQLQVVKALCGAWLRDDPLEQVPTNRQIAAQLGTPSAEEAVKSALRRIYAKLGLADQPAQVKRRSLCRVARHLDWL